MSRKVLGWLLALTVFAVTPAFAQVPTPEGTTITNQAIVSWADANGNTYADTSAVSILVAFKAGVDVDGDPTLPTNAGTTANAVFTIFNEGNGPDSMSVSFTAHASLTNISYKIGASPYVYTTIGEVNDSLAKASFVIGYQASQTITVTYTVANGTGGQTLPMTLTAQSRRGGTITPVTDSFTTNVQPPVFGSVGVTPTGAGNTLGNAAMRVPTGPTGGNPYSATFTLTNSGNTAITYTLTPGQTGAATGATVVGGNSVTVPALGDVTVTVTYTVPVASASGATGTVTLGASANGFPGVTGTGTHYMQVIKPILSIEKLAFRDNGTGTAADTSQAIGGASTVVPDEVVWYRLKITNTSSAVASNVVVTDALPAQVTYNSSTLPSGWTASYASGTNTLTINATSPLAVGSGPFELFVKVTIK